MKTKPSMMLRNLVLTVIKPFKSRIIDYKTGNCVGRALLLPWGGKIHVIGAEGEFIPVFMPQERLTYWKQEIGFTAHPAVDFARIPHEDAHLSTHAPGSPSHANTAGNMGAGSAA